MHAYLMILPLRFESDVISDGTQIAERAEAPLTEFESDVISDGTQIAAWRAALLERFESDVISDGTQILNRFL